MTEHTNPKLLPCPFCGGEAVMGMPGIERDQDGRSRMILMVNCITGGCNAANGCSFPTNADHQEMINFAARTWNRRAPAPVPDALLAMAQLLRTQDNRITDQPIFMVQGLRRRYGFDSDYSDVYVWIDEDQEQADPEQEAELETLGYEDTGVWRRVYYRDEWEHLQPFLTEAWAEEYLRINGHNLSHFMSVRIYVESAYRNGEWKAIREFLLALPEGK